MNKKILKSSAAALVFTVALTGTSFAKNDKKSNVEAPQPVESVENSNSLQRIDPQWGNLDAFYGNLDAFWGNLDAFWGNLDAFYGNLDAFEDGTLNPQYGNLDAFWGNLDAFYGNLDAFYGNLDAFWGSLDAFYGNLDAFYGSLDAFWGNLDAFYGNLDAFDGDPSDLESNLRSLFDQAEDSFGKAVAGQTGESFNDVTSALRDKYGLGSDFSGAENLTRNQYAALLLELHDQMMSYTGLDHVDHWMGSAKWSPKIAQDAGAGEGVKVGILDTQLQFSGMMDGKVKGKGYNITGQDHGAAVASLIGAAHDGSGIMGVAPGVSAEFNNPFDGTMTASWQDAEGGLMRLVKNAKSNVINMSLGVSGHVLHEDWRDVFAGIEANKKSANVVFVKAAGNDGVQQDSDIDWGSNTIHDQLLIVGSVDPSGVISKFSNTPGDACLLVNGNCDPENLLKNRFLVAPGELLLVSDNAGGVTRASGTSFSAPIVTGAVALLQSQWKWLQQNPEETTEIILRSATDLGAPGVDGTYGWGLLNIEASQAPLNANALVVESANGPVSVNQLGGLTPSALGVASSATTITAFEYIGDTYRDFEIALDNLAAPLAANADAPQTSSEDYLAARIAAPAEATPAEPSTTTKKKNKKNKKKFGSFSDTLTLGGARFGNTGSAWRASFDATRRDPNEIVEADAVPFQMSAEVTNKSSGLTLRIGEGNGALAFSNGSQFGLSSDHDIATGGANPLLGLASGGFFAGAELPLGDRLSIAFGVTQDEDRQGYADSVTGEWRETFSGISDYRASAIDMALGYQVASSVSLSLSYTQLKEATGLLGMQGSGAFALEGGAVTDALSFGADAVIGSGYAISVSATAGETRPGSFDQSILAVSEGGISSTAFQIAASKLGVLSEADSIRASFAQPLHVESGSIGVTTMQVVNRETGETAFVTEPLALDGASRRYVSEVLYATPVLGGYGSLNAYGQVELNNRDLGQEKTAVAGGVRFSTLF